MSVRQIKAVGGLSTDPSSLDKPEALRVADNVLLHRDGVIQPRFGFGDTANIAARTTAFRPAALVAFDGDIIVWSTDGSSFRLERASLDAQYTGAVDPFDRETRGMPCFMESRGSLYLTTYEGIKKLPRATTAALSGAGIRTDYAEIITTLVTVNATAENNAIEANSAVAYRYVWVSEDANSYVRRSAPSERFVMRASGGAVAIIDFGRLYLPSGIVAGDHVEIYRTESVSPSTSTPGTEYFLTIDHEVTTSEVAAGYIAAGVLRDTTIDARLGATLYTSPSQGGIGQANEVPPCALVMAEWAGVAWYGDTQSRRTLQIEVISVFDETEGGGAYDLTGIHWGIVSADLTIGSTTIPIASTSGANRAAAGLRVGQYVWDSVVESPLQDHSPSGTPVKIPPQTKITGVSSFVTIANNGTLPDDTITIWGETFTWKASPTLSTHILVGTDANASAINLRDKLNGWNWAEPVTVVATSSTNVVTITEAAGNGVRIAVSDASQTLTYSITVSNAALDNIGSYLIEIGDYVVVDGLEFYASSPGAAIGWQDVSTGGNPQYRTFNAVGNVTQSTAISTVVAGLARGISAYTVTVDPTFGIVSYRDNENLNGSQLTDGVLTLLRTTPGLGDFVFDSPLRPEAFRPYGTPAQQTLDTRRRNRLYWSKPQEPEAVPILNFTDIGRSDAELLALVPLNTAMLVFKEDGVWVITGYAPNAWTVTELDATLRLITSTCTAVLGDVCYAWTDTGVAAITQSSSQIISGPIGVTLRDVQLDAADCEPAIRITPEGYRRITPDGSLRAVQSLACDRRAFWMLADDRYGLVVVGTGANDAAQSTTNEYVFHTTTGRWSRWPLGLRCATYDARTSRMIVSRDVDAWNVFGERTTEQSAQSYMDASISGLTTVSVVGAVVTVSGSFGAFTPAIGDVLVAGNFVGYRITNVAFFSPNWILTVDATGFEEGSVTWHQSYLTTLVWQAQTVPGVGARWQELHVHLAPEHTVANYSGYTTTYPMDIGGVTEMMGPATVTATVASPPSTGKIVRVGLPRNCLRATHLYPTISINTAGAYWRISELALHGTQTSRRTAR